MEHSGNCVTNCPESPIDIPERSDLINRNIHKMAKILRSLRIQRYITRRNRHIYGISAERYKIFNNNE